jgi:hypothetical protein
MNLHRDVHGKSALPVHMRALYNPPGALRQWWRSKIQREPKQQAISRHARGDSAARLASHGCANQC